MNKNTKTENQQTSSENRNGNNFKTENDENNFKGNDDFRLGSLREYINGGKNTDD